MKLTIRLKLKNNVGQIIDVTNFLLKEEDGTDLSTPCLVEPSGVALAAWRVGEVREFTWSGCDFTTTTGAGFVIGEKGKFLVSMTFQGPAGTSYAQIAEGEVIITVQP